MIKVIESKYSAKIREMMDTHTQVVGEAQAKVRRLEAELKQINERYHVEQRGKITEQGNLEKRCMEL